jgi:hypothetical protein
MTSSSIDERDTAHMCIAYVDTTERQRAMPSHSTSTVRRATNGTKSRQSKRFSRQRAGCRRRTTTGTCDIDGESDIEGLPTCFILLLLFCRLLLPCVMSMGRMRDKPANHRSVTCRTMTRDEPLGLDNQRTSTDNDKQKNSSESFVVERRAFVDVI